MTETLQSDELTRKRVAAVLKYDFDWTDLPGTASIVTSTITASAIEPSTATALVLDAATTAARATSVRIAGGQDGALYKITNAVVTDEATPQTYVGVFELLVEA